MTILLIITIAIVALYFGIGIGVFLMTRERYRYHMGGPPAIFYMACLVNPFAVIADYRRAEKLRRAMDTRQ